jgi:hypothetical protein
MVWVKHYDKVKDSHTLTLKREILTAHKNKYMQFTASLYVIVRFPMANKVIAANSALPNR